MCIWLIYDVYVNVQLLAWVTRERSHGVIRQPDQEYTLILASNRRALKSLGSCLPCSRNMQTQQKYPVVSSLVLLDQVSSSAAQGTSGLHMILLLTAGRCHNSQTAAIAQLMFCCVQDRDIRFGSKANCFKANCFFFRCCSYG